jgi:hypothetical protein
MFGAYRKDGKAKVGFQELVNPTRKSRAIK